MTRDAYEVVIPLCPKCGSDMQDMCGMSEEAWAAIANETVEGTHFCPRCKIYANEDAVETRTEFHQMICHADESSEALIELRIGNSPKLERASSHWYSWENNQPVPTTDYTGVDDTFEEIMTAK